MNHEHEHEHDYDLSYESSCNGADVRAVVIPSGVEGPRSRSEIHQARLRSRRIYPVDVTKLLSVMPELGWSLAESLRQPRDDHTQGKQLQRR